MVDESSETKKIVELRTVEGGKEGEINLHYHTVRNPRFLSVLRDLRTAPLMMRVAHRLFKLCQKLDKEMQDSGKLYLELVKAHAECLENGSPKINEQGHLVFLSPEKEGEFKTKYREFLMLKMETRLPKFTIRDLEEAKLSMEDLEVILPILDEDVV